MNRLISVACVCLLLGGCINSYEEEYKAALQELEVTKHALAEAQRKLQAADNEIRHKIFSLARRINNYIQVTELDVPLMKQMIQEMGVHFDSYSQLSQKEDLTWLIAKFYKQKTDTVLHLKRQRDSAYNKQYNLCLSDLDSKGGKNQLSTMLCEVQADVAKGEYQTNLNASIKALVFVGDELLRSRGSDAPVENLAQVEDRFQHKFNELKKQQAG